MRFRYRPPRLIRKIFNGFTWESSNNKILFTFDDGPTDSATNKILNILNRHNLKAVFFCVGSNINKHPKLVQNMIRDGHTIANHTMNHKLLTKMSREESIVELSTFNELMKDKFNYNVKYFRPAHGRFNLKTNGILKELNLECVMWNLLTYDYENNIEKVKYAIDNYLKENSIIVFHDSIKCDDIIEESLIYTVEQANKKGFKFGEPENCLK